MRIDEAIPTILRRKHGMLTGPTAVISPAEAWREAQLLDTFECMILVEDASTSLSSPRLDHWAVTDPVSLVARLAREPRKFTLATLLHLSPHGLGCLSWVLPHLQWLEAARAANNISADQLSKLGATNTLEAYLHGDIREAPRLDLPMVFPLPAPSVLRVIQNLRFRFRLQKEQGYQEAMQRYIRFYC
jgi:hypothetical protein